jgi:ABC-type dipeptide/oligopeptide/nickel transport system permease component
VGLAKYLLRRLGAGLLAMLGVSVLVFLMLHVVPGDPVDHLAGGEATPDQRKKIEACMGLDQPMYVQFGTFLEHVVDGSLGHQCPDPKNKPTVAGKIGDVWMHTVWLAIGGMLVAIVLAIPLGVLAAVRRGTWVDTLAAIGGLAGVAVPMMLMAPVMLLVFFIDLGTMPGPTETGPAALVLPSVAIGVHLLGMLSRMTRASMVDVLDEDYVRTAKAKGLGRGTVLYKHAPAQRAPAGDHDRRPAVRLAAVGRDHRREGVRAAGVGPHALDRDLRAQLPAGAGLRARDRGHLRHRQPAGRPGLRPGRSEDPAGMSLRRGWGRLSLSGKLGAVMVAIFIVVGIVGPWLAPHSATRIDLDHQFLPPSSRALARHRSRRHRRAVAAAVGRRARRSSYRWWW